MNRRIRILPAAVVMLLLAAAQTAAAADAGHPVQSSTLIPARVVHARWSVMAIAAGVFVVVLVATMLLLRPNRHRSLSFRLRPYTELGQRPAANTGASQRRSLVAVVSRALESVLGGISYWKRAAQMIERADLPLRTSELLYVQIGLAVVLGVPAGLAHIFAPLALGLFAFGFLLPYMVVRFRARRRMRRFDEQLPDMLVAMAASLKAGHSWNQAMATVIEEGSDPTAKEFGRVANETRLGRPSEEALEAMAARLGSVDFDFVVTSVNIQRQVGGSLAELLDQVGETVRHRQQFRRKVKALTAMGRMSAYTLVALPFLMAFGISLINAHYLAPLFTTSAGHILIIAAFTALLIGGLLLKKIVSFRV